MAVCTDARSVHEMGIRCRAFANYVADDAITLTIVHNAVICRGAAKGDFVRLADLGADCSEG